MTTRHSSEGDAVTRFEGFDNNMEMKNGRFTQKSGVQGFQFV